MPLTGNSTSEEYLTSQGIRIEVEVPFSVDNGTLEIGEADSSNNFVVPSGPGTFRNTNFYIIIRDATGKEVRKIHEKF